MTLHIHYSHQCESCKAFYIPYDTEVPCPNCGIVEAERFDFIPEAAQSMSYNKMAGRYMPGAWWVSGLADHILMILFGLFDGYEAQRGILPFEAYLGDQLGRMEWGEQEYLRDHIHGIALRVRDVLKVD